MLETKNARNDEVKVEALLRLKRSERPDDAFWDSFDRELHQRMLQTLVKKDPWYVQMLRGVSGRIAQTAAVGAAAALLAVVLVRPVFVEVTESATTPVSVNQGDEDASGQAIEPSVTARLPLEVAMSDLDESVIKNYHKDYRMEAVSTMNAGYELGYTRDYSHDSIEVVAYDSGAYVTDTASFAGSGIATGLVY